MRALALAIVVACSSPSAPAPPAPVPAEPPGKARAPDVHVDRRVELLAIVNHLAGAPEYRTGTPSPYLRAIDAELGAFTKSRAVVMTRELQRRGLRFEQPMTLAIRLDDSYRLVRDARELDARWRADGSVVDYVDALREFATDAKLDAFFTRHAAYFSTLEAQYRAALAKENPVPWFDDLFGATGAQFTVVPAPIVGTHNFGVRAGDAMLQVIGLGATDAEGLPTIDDEVMQIIVHEMAHSFINPLVERHFDELAPAAASIFKLVERDMSLQSYGAPKIMLFESCVRAVTTLYIREHETDRAAADATRREVRRGFVWTAELADVFAKFHKAKTRDLEKLAPPLVTFFAQLAKRYESGLPPTAFLGPIDGVVIHPPFVLVHSPAPKLVAYVTQVRDQIMGGVPKIVGGSFGTFDELPHVGLMAYGSPAGNPVVSSILQRSHIELGADKLAIGTRVFTGPHLVLVAGWPRADDPSKGIAIYASANDDDVVGIHGLHLGSTDWVVARRLANGTFELLAQGDFPHAHDGAWLLP